MLVDVLLHEHFLVFDYNKNKTVVILFLTVGLSLIICLNKKNFWRCIKIALSVKAFKVGLSVELRSRYIFIKICNGSIKRFNWKEKLRLKIEIMGVSMKG